MSEAERKARRRRQSIADTYKPDEQLDRMAELKARDPKEFERTYGAHGDVLLGLHQAARQAAEDVEP